MKIKSSSPKILPLCPALVTLASGPHALDFPERKGRVFEAAVGADLLRIPGGTLHYWRDGADEVDFVLALEGDLYAVEVKSHRPKAGRGLNVFQRRFSRAKACVVNFENYLQFSEAPASFLKEKALS